MIDWNEPIETVNGSPASLLHTLSGEEKHRRVVLYDDYLLKREHCVFSDEEGALSTGGHLFRNKEKEQSTTIFVNVYRNAPPCVHPDRETAARERSPFPEAGYIYTAFVRLLKHADCFSVETIGKINLAK